MDWTDEVANELVEEETTGPESAEVWEAVVDERDLCDSPDLVTEREFVAGS